MSSGTWGIDFPFVAVGDLSSYQYMFVEMDVTAGNQNSKKVKLATANGRVIGILQNKPSAAGEEAIVRILGVSKLVMTQTGLLPGDFLTALATGKGEEADAADEYVGAQIISVRPSYAANETADVLICHFRSSIDESA